MLTGLPGVKTVGVPSAAAVDKGVTGLCARCPRPMIPAQGVGTAGTLIQWKRAGVIVIPGSCGILVFLHGILRVFILIVLGGHLAILLRMGHAEHGHRVELRASGVCCVTREGS